MQIYCDYCFYGITYEERIKCSCEYDICINCIINLKVEQNFKQFHESHIFCFIKKDYYKSFTDKIFLESLFFCGIINLEDIAILLKCTEEQIEDKFTSHFNLEKITFSNFTNEKYSLPKHKYLPNYFPKREEIDFDLYDYSFFYPIRNDLSTVNIDILFEIYRSHNQFLKYFEKGFIEKNLVNFHIIKKKISKLNKKKQEIIEKNKVFYQFISRKDFNIYLKGLLEEENMKRKFYTGKINIDYDKMLNETEISFCKKINIDLNIYQKLKSYFILMMNYEKTVSKEVIESIVKGNKKQIEHIYMFFKLNNWIK